MLQQEHRVLAGVCWIAGICACLRDQLLLPSPGLPCDTAKCADGADAIRLQSLSRARAGRRVLERGGCVPLHMEPDAARDHSNGKYARRHTQADQLLASSNVKD